MNADDPESDLPSPLSEADEPDISYAAAVTELDELLGDLERDDVDIDELAANVRRAATLIAVCRARLDQARVEVERIVAELGELD